MNENVIVLSRVLVFSEVTIGVGYDAVTSPNADPSGANRFRSSHFKAIS